MLCIDLCYRISGFANSLRMGGAEKYNWVLGKYQKVGENDEIGNRE